MTHLLGRQDCVESLRRDVIDLQAAVLDVFSRTGPVRVPSWKFPDKVSCNVDLVQLLQEYDYTEGEPEFNQHSHIVLLELVIDRLMLLLQSFNIYTEMMMGDQRGHSGKTGQGVSIGPVVKRYWTNLVRLSSQQQQGRTTSKNSQRSPSAPQHSISQTDITSSTARSALSTPASKLQNPRPASSSPSRTAPPAPASESRSVSVQTVESALVPCTACARVQSSLKESAEACLSLCRALGVNSFLQHLLMAVEDTEQLGRLTASDLAQWACEQRKDMGRIEQHITEVKETVDSLRNKLKKAEEQRGKLRAQLEQEKERAEREREERMSREEEWECQLQELKTRGEVMQRKLQEEQEEIKRGAKALEIRVSELSRELELQRETQQCLQCERDSLVEEVHRLHLQEEERKREYQESRRELETELSNIQTLLDKESAKYRSAHRQHEAMQVKQHALLERVDALVQQCEDLQTRLEECEDERTELTHTLTHTTQERDTLQEQITKQKSQYQSLTEERERQIERVCELEKSVCQLNEDLQQAAQRERILVAFPELNPQHTAPQSTGDVLGDMEQQLKANSLRIRVLEHENASLVNSLARLKDNAQCRGDQPGCQHSEGPAGCKTDSAARLRSCDYPTSQQSSSPSPLHQQTLCLSLSPNAAETYTKIRQTARTRSAGIPRRRK
ncbi:coiled-coil domain-containing protein 157 [Astyanax mexicanus]|uniref:Coiled-coil domain-containing protein 157 n=3 Tax=Astyanax mexicanus TaxID=7994 RepID=A0A8T2LKU3_ASTMX|nr:coiled-coil domain-containing protein 157 [Astyanax mexicanus]